MFRNLTAPGCLLGVGLTTLAGAVLERVSSGGRCRSKPGSVPRTIFLLLVVSAFLPTLVACDEGPTATSPQAESELPAEIASGVAEAEATAIVALASSGHTYCGRLCQPVFWLDSDVDALESELARGASIDAKDRRGNTPLHYAALLADFHVVDYLLNKGAQIEAVNDGMMTPLHVAANDGVLTSFHTSETVGGSLLSRSHHPIFHSQSSAVVMLLLERGADPNARTDWGLTPLHRVRDPVVATLLLLYGADVEAKTDEGGTPLFYAASDTRDPAIVALLLEHGANVDEVGEYGMTPFYSAVQRRSNAELLGLLLKHGADVNARGRHGWTPLHEAVNGRDHSAIVFLLANGADINAAEDDGETACDYGRRSSRPDDILNLVCP